MASQKTGVDKKNIIQCQINWITVVFMDMDLGSSSYFKDNNYAPTAH